MTRAARAIGAVGAIRVALRVRRLPDRPDRIARLLARAAAAAASTRRVAVAELSIAVVGDRRMRRLNREFHRDDRTTDVLAFPLGEAPAGPRSRAAGIDGEVIVCAPYARREASCRSLPWRVELALYVAHGVLHLAGEDDADKKGAARMRRFERAALAKLQLHLPNSHLDEAKSAGGGRVQLA